MVTITETSRDFNEIEQYLMTLSPDITSLKDVPDGTKITVDGYLHFEDEKETGEVSSIMSIITPEKEVYSCQSATFKRSVHNIANIMHGKPFAIIKTSGETKAGRVFINCTLDIASIK